MVNESPKISQFIVMCLTKHALTFLNKLGGTVSPRLASPMIGDL